MSDDHRRVRWHDNGRGPRVTIDIAGASVVTTAEQARGLRDELTVVLDEISARPSGPASADLTDDRLAAIMEQTEQGAMHVRDISDVHHALRELKRRRAAAPLTAPTPDAALARVAELEAAAARMAPVVAAADAWLDDPCKGLGSHREAALAAEVTAYRARVAGTSV